MGTVKAQGHSEDTQKVAILHDAVEPDAQQQISLEELEREGFGDEVILPLQLLIKPSGVKYELYIERVAVNSRSRAVKKADLFDNMDLTGLENPSLMRIETIEKYGRALLYIARFPQPRV